MTAWQTHLVSLVQTHHFTTQSDIVTALHAAGFLVNQTTVSRALKRMGIAKSDGHYQRLVADPTGVIHSVKVAKQNHLVVVRTQPAFAGVVAQRVDEANLPGVLGTIAGDDTIFIATSGAEALEQLAQTLPWPPLLSVK